MNIFSQPASKQSGAVLIVALVILWAMAMLGVGGMHTSLLQERMAGNTLITQMAFQAAEAGLRDGERDVENNINHLTLFSASCTHGLCEPSHSGTPVWKNNSIVNWVTALNTIDYGQNTGANPLGYLAIQPRYIIEKLPAVEQGLTPQPTWYRVTAMGFAGTNSQSSVMLQSVYCKLDSPGSSHTLTNYGVSALGRQSWQQLH